MALPTAHILEYNQLLSFHVVFSSYRHFRKAQYLPDESKVKSWGKGILDLNFDSRNCVIRINGENSTILMQPFSEFRAIAAKAESEVDQLLTLTFDSDEWDIISQSVAEAACIMHLAQYIGKNQIFTAAEVAKAGLQKGVIGLEQTPVFKQGLVQELDNVGRKVRVRFLVVVPGKVFGFQRQQEIVGHPASFVTSLFNASVTTASEVPGFQLQVDRMEPLYFDTMQEDERPSWITELNASIEVTRDAINGILVTARPATRPSKVQWKDTSQDAEEGSTVPSTIQKADLDLSQEPPAGSEKYNDDLGSKQTDAGVSARNKPLSRARICLEDSLTELRILVSHVQAASNVLHDLHLFTSSTSSLREKKKFISPVTLRWPSTGKERSWPHSDWQRRYLYDSSYEDLLTQRNFPPSSKSEAPDIVYDTTNLVKQIDETSSSGRPKENDMESQSMTFNHEQPTTTSGEQGKVQATKSLFNSTKSFSLEAQNPNAEEPDVSPVNVMRKSTKKQMCTSDAPEDLNEAPYIERNSESANPSYFRIEKDSGATAFQQLSAVPAPDTVHIQMGAPKSVMMKPSLYRQASARAPRAVAFMAEPEITSFFDDAASFQVEAQPQASAVMRHASDEPIHVQNGGIVRPLASKPRASQTEFPLAEYQPPIGQDSPQQYQGSPSFLMGPSQFSAPKSNVQALGYAQSKQQSANLDEMTTGNREGHVETEKTGTALPSGLEYDSADFPQSYEDEKDTSSTIVDDPPQDYQQAANNLEGPERLDARKSTSNLRGGTAEASQQGDSRRQTYQGTSQATNWDLKKSVVNKQQQGSPYQLDTRKSFAARQSQAVPPQTETRKSVAVNRQSQDATVQPDVRKSIVPDRQSEAGVQFNRSMSLNQQNPDATPQQDIRRSFVNRASSMQQPPAMTSYSRAAAESLSRPSPPTVEIRKSVYQGPSSFREEPNSPEQTSGQLLGESNDLHQEADLSDSTSSGSSSSERFVGAKTLTDPVSGLSRSELGYSQNGDDEYASPALSFPARAVPTESRKLGVSYSSNSGAGEQVAASHQSRISSVAARPSSFDGHQPAMRGSPARGKSQAYVSFDGSLRGPDGYISGRRQSH